MPLTEITQSIQDGMAGTLGFVATVVGLGAIFGQMLESSGGAESLAHSMVKKFGKDRASWAMVITGFSGCRLYYPCSHHLRFIARYETFPVVLCHSAAGRVSSDPQFYPSNARSGSRCRYH